jgi:murein DD-endopeptidase MepM/ murein hydrolase activator NlpD
MIDVDYFWPTKQRDINDGFDDHAKRGSSVPGIDINVPTGTKVFAAADGHVELADGNPKQNLGCHVVIRHKDHKETLYCHLSKVMLRNGQQVKAGELIALSGATGDVTGAHLHFSISRGGKFLDPEVILKKEAKERRAEKAAAETLTVPDASTPVASPGTVAG